MTREYIDLKEPTPDAIRNAATKNRKGTWVRYGVTELSEDLSTSLLSVPSEAVLKAARDQAAAGVISLHRARGKNGFSEYVFKVL